MVAGAACVVVGRPILMVVWLYFGNPDVKRDLEKGAISQICGIIFLDIPDVEKGKNPKGWHLRWQSFYTLEVNGMKFIIPKRRWEELLDYDRRPLCIYYAPNSKTIMSVERPP
jgi:hypothetical protein